MAAAIDAATYNLRSSYKASVASRILFRGCDLKHRAERDRISAARARPELKTPALCFISDKRRVSCAGGTVAYVLLQAYIFIHATQ